MNLIPSTSSPPITDESRVTDYVLPPLLSGKSVPEAWPARRQELIALLSDHAYGRTPASPPEGGIRIHELARGAAPHVPGGTRIQLALDLGPAGNLHRIHVLLYLPASKPTRLFLGLNFAGNHTIDPDPGILLPEKWMYPWPGTGVVDHRATATGRGTRSRRWPVDMILQNGCALATFYCGDLAPEQAGHPQTAAFKRLFPEPDDPLSEWGNIGIWAWGLCRIRGALAALPELKAVPCVAAGHSRLGKAALWAAAQEEAFAGAFSNCSGCMGAALSRRRFGETVNIITSGFPHWFCPRLRTWADREGDMPFDQHMLLALIAPRSLLVGSADGDLWADPRGEFLAAAAASDAYALYGYGKLDEQAFPPADRSVFQDQMGYFLRAGTHDMPSQAWEQALIFFSRRGGCKVA